MFKSPNDTSRYFFPSEDLFVISEVRDVKSIKNPSCVLPWGIFPRFFSCKSGNLCGNVQAAVLLWFYMLITFTMIYNCTFFFRLASFND